MTDQATNYLNEHNKYDRLNSENASLKTELANARVVLAAYDELVDGLRAELAQGTAAALALAHKIEQNKSELEQSLAFPAYMDRA
jgi:hypothetical protein